MSEPEFRVEFDVAGVVATLQQFRDGGLVTRFDRPDEVVVGMGKNPAVTREIDLPIPIVGRGRGGAVLPAAGAGGRALVADGQLLGSDAWRRRAAAGRGGGARPR